MMSDKISNDSAHDGGLPGDRFQHDPLRAASDHHVSMSGDVTVSGVRKSSSLVFRRDEIIADRYVVKGDPLPGGMGTVYLVYDQIAKQDRALKVMAEAIAQDPQAKGRFLTESQVNLRHPHIVQTIDIGQWSARNLLFITMEFVAGQNLRDWFVSKKPALPFSLTGVLELIRQLLAALIYAHETGTIHRDIKPENLLIICGGERPILKLGDFGIARLLQAGEHAQTMGAIGTISYMSPEQKRGNEEITPRSDLYSVGVVLYELLTGRLPEGKFKAVSELRSDIPKSVDAIIDRALSPEPAERFADASWMLAEVETVLKTLMTDLQPVTVQPTEVQVRNLDFSRLVIELEQRRAPQVSLPGFPPIPEEILELEGKLQSLQLAVEQLKADTHPALRNHQAALHQLEEQLSRHQHELEANTPAELSQEVRSKLQSIIDEDPLCNPVDLADAAPECPIEVIFPYAERLCNAVESRASVNNAVKEYGDARHAETERLQSEMQVCEKKLQQLKLQDFDSIVRIFLTPFVNDEKFPLSAWAMFHKDVLSQRRYPGNSRDWLVHANAVRADETAVDAATVTTRFSTGTSTYESDVSISAILAKIRAYNKKKGGSNTAGPFSSSSFMGRNAGEAISIKLNNIEIQFCWCPAGELVMGSPVDERGRLPQENQVHVTLSRGFWMGRFPVTQNLFESVVGYNSSHFILDGANKPVEMVTWGEACAFCRSVTDLMRERGLLPVEWRIDLPTEAQWEYACRAGTSTAFSFGSNNETSVDPGRFLSSLGMQTHDVGQFEPNLWGLHEMNGNVEQWCLDKYSSTLLGGRDPIGPSSGDSQVVRGASFASGPLGSRCAFRSSRKPNERNRFTGFRIVGVVK